MLEQRFDTSNYKLERPLIFDKFTINHRRLIKTVFTL